MTEALADAYVRARREATTVAGEPGDLQQQVLQLRSIYADSQGNHPFPQVAVHGALWACHFFGNSGPVSRAISYRYAHSRDELEHRSAMLQRFSVRFREASRSVFIDTYTNYYFTKACGEAPGADQHVNPRLLDCLNQVHRAARFGRPVNVEDKQVIFIASLEWEQEAVVVPRLQEEVSRFDCPVLTRLVLKPFVRFAYFPPWYYMHFKNFADPDERMEKAIESYELAEQAGWPAVAETIRSYDVLPEDLLVSP